MSWTQLCGVDIPTPVRTRTVSNLEMVKASRLHQQDKDPITPFDVDAPVTADERYNYNIVAVESYRRILLTRGTKEHAATVKACDFKNALVAMSDKKWGKFKFELIGGWCDFLLPYLD